VLPKWIWAAARCSNEMVSELLGEASEEAGQNLRLVCAFFELWSTSWLTSMSFFGILLIECWQIPGYYVRLGRSRDRFPVVSLDSSVTYAFRPYHGAGVDSAPSENEYQEHFLEVKATGAWGWPHHLNVPNVMKSGSLNLLEPSGPHRAWYGIALSFSTLDYSTTASSRKISDLLFAVVRPSKGTAIENYK
jgi:hypothetical protein